MQILLAKGAVEMVLLANNESGFYSRYLLAPKKDCGLRPILLLCHEVRRRGSFPSKTDGNPHIVLLQQLACTSQLRTAAYRSQVVVAQPTRASWAENQSSQEFSDSQTVSIPSGINHRLCKDASLDYAGTLPGIFQAGDCTSSEGISENHPLRSSWQLLPGLFPWACFTRGPFSFG